MSKLKRIPDAEFEIMKVIWENEPPITTNMLMNQIEKEWRVQTLITLLMRLVERGFLSTEKNGKERTFFPLITKEEYLKFETGNFMERFHGNSFASLLSSLYDGKKLSDKDIEELSNMDLKSGD